MRTTEELRKEHRGIEQMLRIVETVSRRMEAGYPLEHEDLDGIIEFLSIFLDKCHHGKEEELLFPAMEAVGIPRQGGPIGVMLAEHAEGRKLKGRLADAIETYKAGKVNAAADFDLIAKEFVKLITLHIQKEDNILYPLAEKRISGEKDAELFAAFEKLELERIGKGKHDQFHILLHRLKKKFNIA